MSAHTGEQRSASSAIFVAVVLLLAGALVVEAVILMRPRPKPKRPAEAERAIAQAGAKVETFGDKQAPIKIEFYAPLTLEWHQKTIGLLKEYDRAHPGRIHVTLMPMGNSQCDQTMQGRGYTCAVIFINGKEEFTLPDGRTVTLQKKPNATDSFYKSEDVITIVDQLWKELVR